MKKAIEVLWTGGWDSTFRVLYASLIEEKEVYPHYIIDFGRKSSCRELEAISDIRRELKKIDSAAAERVKELKITPITEIKPSKEITRSYHNLKNQAHLGSQYDWLSRYARSNDINDLELSVHVDDKAYFFLQGNVVHDEHGRWRLKDSAEGDIAIFSCFTFPILEISKTEMRYQAEKSGFIDALEMSWFCFNPRGGNPCGECNPCVYTIEEGMAYRFTNYSLFRYKIRYIRKSVKFIALTSLKIYRKIKYYKLGNSSRKG